MPKIYKNIPVSPETYEKVSVIAKSCGRTMGGQVMIWGRECSHPADLQILLGKTTVIQPGNGLTISVQILLCKECGRLQALPVDPFDADQRTISAEAAAIHG